MGKEYSKEEMIEFRKYKTNLDKAVNDNEPYSVYKNVKKELSVRLCSTSYKNVERYSVDYIKEVVKSPKSTG